MTTPTIPLKKLMGFGMRKGSAWGDAVALGATYGVLLESNGGLNRTQPYLPAVESDTPMTKEGDLGPIDPITFAPEFTMRYDPGGIALHLALLFGTAGAPDNKGNGAYRHTFQWADENYGDFLTFAEERTGKIFEVASAKPTTFDLTVAEGLIKGSMGMIGNTLINTSSVNTLTQMDALTYKDRGNRLKFIQAVIKMNDQLGGDVSSETALEVSDMTIHYERPQDSVHVAGDASIIETAENAKENINVNLQFPRENTTNMAYFATDFIGEVEKKMEIIITGGIIGGAFSYYMELQFPRLRVLDNPSTYEDVLKNGLMLQAEEPSSVPTGMSYARPHVYLQNNSSADYLA